MRKSILYTLFAGVSLASQAQTQEIVSMGAGYAQNQWYSLENGIVSTSPSNNWDIAFQVGGLADASILINQGKGIKLYEYGSIENWATVDTTGLNWNALNNSPTSWRDGAANQVKDPNNAFDYGWGVYEQSMYGVLGKTAYIIKLDDDNYKKFKIDSLATAGKIYYFTLADLDGGNEVNKTFNKDDFAGKAFGYYGIIEDNFLDRENIHNEDWDFLFTQYVDIVPNPLQPGVFEPHSVTGILSNAKVEVAQIDSVNPESYTDWWNATYSKDINTIGYDWKEFNMTTFQYSIDSNRVYFVKAANGDVWKVIMTGFGGGSTGEFNFTKEKMSTASIDENGIIKPEILIYPNPATDKVSIILNNLANNDAQIKISNMAGQTVYNNDLKGVNNFEIKNIPVYSLQSGIYLITVKTNNKQIINKLIIK